MMFNSLLTPEQWAEARRLRAEGAPFAALAKQFGVAHSTIGRRARQEGWSSPAGSPSTRAPAKSKAPPPPTPPRSAAPRAPRLSRHEPQPRADGASHEKQLKDAKKKDADIPAIDAEKDMRQLASAMKTIEQTTELDPDLHRAADGGAKSSDAASPSIRGGRPTP